MRAPRTLLVPVLVAVLVALLVGPAVVTAAEPRAVSRTVTVPAAAFAPGDDDTGFINDGYQVVVVGPSTNGEFVAPLFLEAEAVTIRRMTLYAYDNGADDICLTLYRLNPATVDDQVMGEVCSTGAASGVRTFVLPGTGFTRRIVNGGYGPYLHLWVPGTYGDGYSFYAVKIVYSY